MTLKRDLKIILIKNLLSYFKRITVSFHALPGKSEEVDSFSQHEKGLIYSNIFLETIHLGN